MRRNPKTMVGDLLKSPLRLPGIVAGFAVDIPG
jgi:hypothetical protein